MKRNDIILIGIILVISCILLCIMRPNYSSDMVEIILDGNLYGTYSLWENQVIEVKANDGINVVEITDGRVHIIEANCKDQYCMKQGYLPSYKNTLICLPHKLIVRLNKKVNNQETDAITG